MRLDASLRADQDQRVSRSFAALSLLLLAAASHGCDNGDPFTPGDGDAGVDHGSEAGADADSSAEAEAAADADTGEDAPPGPWVRITFPGDGESVPNPVTLRWEAGGVVATVAMFTPSFVILAAIAPYFDRLRRYPLFGKAVTGILASFVGLLLSTAIRFGLAAHWSPVSIVLGCGAFVALMLKVDILWVVVIGALLSAALL